MSHQPTFRQRLTVPASRFFRRISRTAAVLVALNVGLIVLNDLAPGVYLPAWYTQAADAVGLVAAGAWLVACLAVDPDQLKRHRALDNIARPLRRTGGDAQPPGRAQRHPIAYRTGRGGVL